MAVTLMPNHQKLKSALISIVKLAVAGLALVSCVATPAPTATSIPPTPTLTPTNTPTITPTPTNTPIPTLAPLAVPTPAPGAEITTWSNDQDRTGWFGSRDNQPHWREPNLLTGFSQNQVLLSVIQFDVTSLAPNTRILFGALEITGRDSSRLGATGDWTFDLVDSAAIKDDTNFDSINRLSPLASLGSFGAQTITAALTKRIVFSSSQLLSIANQLEVGRVTVRVKGPSTGTDNVFGWDGAPGAREPKLYLQAIPGPFVVVTNTPAPDNVFAAATSSARQTIIARAIGTPTPSSRIIQTATPPPVSAQVYVPPPTAVNPREVIATAVYATAVAFTTGTFTPPARGAIATPRPILIPASSLTPVPTPTQTIVPITIPELARKPLPDFLYNKIAFLSTPRDNPTVWVMDPDGSNLALLTDRTYYDIAAARDTISPDGNLQIYNTEDGRGIINLFLTDFRYPFLPPRQLTFASRGFVYAPAWSPNGQRIAYTSTQDYERTQEIFIGDLYFLKPIDPGTNAQLDRLTFIRDPHFWNQYPSWSPDGKQIVFSSDRGHPADFTEIWMMNVDRALKPSDQFDADFAVHKLGDGIRDAWAPVWIKWRR